MNERTLPPEPPPKQARRLQESASQERVESDKDLCTDVGFLANASMCCAFAGLSFVLCGMCSSLMTAPSLLAWSLSFCSAGAFLGWRSRESGRIRLVGICLNCLGMALALLVLLVIVGGISSIGGELDGSTDNLDKMLDSLRQMQGMLE